MSFNTFLSLWEIGAINGEFKNQFQSITVCFDIKLMSRSLENVNFEFGI